MELERADPVRLFNSLVVAIRRHAEQSVERVRRADEHALEKFRNGCGGGGGSRWSGRAGGCGFGFIMNGRRRGEQLDELALFGAARMINAARVELDLELADRHGRGEERRGERAVRVGRRTSATWEGARARRSRDHNADFYLGFRLATVRPFFSASWLRSSVVSVLISLITNSFTL